MKRAISMILLFLVCLSITVPAWANSEGGENNSTSQTPCFTVTYEDLPNGFSLPGNDVSFTAILTDKPEDSGDKMITFGTQSISGHTVTVPINFPKYEVIGEYKYTITQSPGNIAGVYYDDVSMVFGVFAGYNDNDQIGVVETSVDNNDENNGKKTGFNNIYSTGSLNVSNTVSGNVGDRNRPFEIIITFSAPANQSIPDTITYIDPETSKEKTISATAWTISENEPAKKAVSVSIKLKSGNATKFNNVPQGVAYEVSQEVVEGYTLNYQSTNIGEITGGATTNTGVNNTMSSGLGTGIFMQRTPYILVLILGIGGLVLVLRGNRKRGF